MGFIQQQRYDSDYDFLWGGGVSVSPQILVFENYKALAAGGKYYAYSNAYMSFQAVNIPVSISFNKINILYRQSRGLNEHPVAKYSFGLYSLNGSSLSLANSASGSHDGVSTGATYTSWLSMATSATQNISPGGWYYGFIVQSTTLDIFGQSGFSFHANESSYGVSNAQPFFIYGHMSVTTGGVPSSVATSDLDITGADATRQVYIIITA